MVLFSSQIKVTKLGKSMHEDEILALQKLSNLLCIWTENIHKLNRSEREQQLSELKLLKHLDTLKN